MPTYYTIITDAGQALLADAIASGQPVVLTQFAVGDGSGVPVTPDPAMTALVNEVYRGNISSLGTNPEQPNAMVAQLVIPKESGGYTVREVGLFTDDGTMFSIGNYPDQPKPPTDSGYAVKLDMRYMLVVSDTSAITVVIPPGDYLTKEEADTLYLKIGFNLSEIAENGAPAQQEARDNLGCGTAATHDVTETPDDATAGRVLKTGDFGLGGFLSMLPNLNVTSFHSKGVGHADNPEPSQGYAHINLGVSGSYKTTLAIGYTQDPRVFCRSSLNENPTAWAEIYSTHKKPTAGDVGALPSTGGKVTGAVTIENVAPQLIFSEADTGKKYILVADGNNIRLDEDSTAGNNVWTWSSETNNFSVNGRVSVTDWGNFDARYLQMPSAGGVGDVALVRSTSSTQYLHGASVPGSALQYAGLYTETDGNDPDIRTETKTLSGTWRITGTMVNPPTTYPMRVTTAIRIA